MKRSCVYCGRYHDVKHVCNSKPSRVKVSTAESKFRNTWKWKKKSVEIRQRDKGLCQYCIRQTPSRYTFDTIEVHHVIKLSVDMSKGLNNDWLISLCKPCHVRADNYEIPQVDLHEMAMDQEKKNNL